MGRRQQTMQGNISEAEPEGLPVEEKPPGSLSRQVAGAMFWNVALFPLKFAVGLVAGIVVPNLLGLERYGLYILITSVASTIGSYADLGMERALPRYIPEVAHRFGVGGLRRFLREVLGVKLGLILVLAFLLNLFSGPLLGYMRAGEVAKEAAVQARLEQTSDPGERARLEADRSAHEALARRLEEEGRLYLLTISGLLVCGAVFDVFTRLLISYFRQRSSNVIELVVAILQPLLIVVLVLVGWDVQGILVALIVTAFVGVLMAWGQVRRAMAGLPEQARERYHRWIQLWPRFLTFSGISYVINLSTWLYDLSFLSLFTAAYLSTRDVASLGVASKFVGLFLGYLMVPLSGIQMPLFAHLYARRGPAELQEAFSILTQFLLLLLLPTGCGLALLSSSLIALFYPGFPPETATLVLVFIVAMFLETIIGTPQNILQVYERYGAILLARLSALVIIPLLILLVPHYGLLGAAAAAGVARLLPRAITFFYGLRSFSLRFPGRFAGRVIAGSAAMLGLLYPLTRWWDIAHVSPSWAGRALTLGKDCAIALVGLVIFWAVLKALGGLEPEGKRRLAEIRFPLKKILLKLL